MIFKLLLLLIFLLDLQLEMLFIRVSVLFKGDLRLDEERDGVEELLKSVSTPFIVLCA
jgi:hypothetical protein